MADGKHDYAFVHMTLKIGSGRSLESRQEVGEMLFDLIKTHFASLMEAVTRRFHLRLQSCTRR